MLSLFRSKLFSLDALIEYLKPFATILIITLAAMQSARRQKRYGRAVIVGLVLSLAGDIFLVLPKDEFIAGLVSFFIAHICYIVAFSTGTRFAARSGPIIVLGVVGGVVLSLLWSHLPSELRWPVLVYVGILVSMASQAVVRFLGMRRPSARLAALGGILFVCSDATLAFDRFRAPFWLADGVVLGTYFAAQWLIARSIDEAEVGGKYLILYEKTSDDFMSLAIGGGANLSIQPFIPSNFLYSSLDLELIGGKTFGKYEKDNLPPNIYFGLGPRVYPLYLLDYYEVIYYRVFILQTQGAFSSFVGWRMFIGGEIPFGTGFVLTPELALFIVPDYI